MPDRSPLFDAIKKLLDSQLEGVLATQFDQQPHTCLMTFAYTPDLKKIIIATRRETEKFTTLQSNPLVSFLVDNRTNKPADFQYAIAISARGKAIELEGKHYESAKDMFLERLPQLRGFMHAQDCTLMAIHVQSYAVVSKFHGVERLEMR